MQFLRKFCLLYRSLNQQNYSKLFISWVSSNQDWGTEKLRTKYFLSFICGQWWSAAWPGQYVASHLTSAISYLWKASASRLSWSFRPGNQMKNEIVRQLSSARSTPTVGIVNGVKLLITRNISDIFPHIQTDPHRIMLYCSVWIPKPTRYFTQTSRPGQEIEKTICLHPGDGNICQYLL